MGVHFIFEFNLGDRRRQADPTRKLGDVIFKRFSIDLDMSHHEISITSQRIEPRNFWSELPSGLPLNLATQEFSESRNTKVGRPKITKSKSIYKLLPAVQMIES